MKRIILAALLLSLLLLSGCTSYQKKYEELQDQYTDLEYKYDLACTVISYTDDFMNDLYGYFYEEDHSFEFIEEEYNKLSDKIYEFQKVKYEK